jgi:6-phosphogluconate dehydrogenase (decarboxylating)
MKVGLIGLGRTGEVMSRRMIKEDIEVWGYRRDYEKDNTANEYSNHRISMAMVYTAALTASEVAQNFNALRGRYGI